MRKETKAILSLAGGFAALELLLNALNSQNSSSGVIQPATLFSGLTQGITNAVGTLTGNKQQDFVTNMGPSSQAVLNQYGIQPIITMTQAALESGWGTSGLTKKANNLYGYTGDAALNHWLAAQGLPTTTDMADILTMDLSAAPFIMMQTHEEADVPSVEYFTHPGDVVSQSPNGSGGLDLMVWRPFRKYDSWLSSVQDWVALMHGPRYALAWTAALKGDLGAFSQAVANAGYATESDYATQLVSVGTTISDIQTA